MSSEAAIQQLDSALLTMYSNASQAEKMTATHYLENFQKSPEAWLIVLDILNTNTQDNIQLKLFAAQTLRSKIIYDLSSQFTGVENYELLKSSLLSIMVKYNQPSQKLIRTQLSIALSHFLLQYLSWKAPVGEILGQLNQDPANVFVVLDFLKILPEELSDVKKTSLTDEEFNSRTRELINDNVELILLLLKNLTDANSGDVALRRAILDSLNSWIREFPIDQLLQIDSLVNLIFSSLSNDESFEKAIDCLITIVRETRDLENYEIIDALYQQILKLNEYMGQKVPDDEYVDGLTRLYVECGESWCTLIGKNSKHFKPLVLRILECTKYDEDLDIVKYTFQFWYQLKQLITLPKFQEAKAEFSDVYLSLISVIIKHLTYPITDNDNDLFNGDKEQEDKFKDFRYEMGDVLKDCCAVAGATKALQVPFEQIQSIISNSQGHWQYLEAPLFSMRTMAKEVSLKEKTILPTIMSYLIQLPEHPKIRYAATLVLGRYTEWTAKHPEFLEPQLNYIIKGFEVADNNNDIIMATSHALMYFCQDCSELLVNYLEQLYMLYGQVKDKMDLESNYELADGLAHVIAKIPRENMYKTTEMFIDPTIELLTKTLAESPNDTTNKLIADQIEIISIFIDVLKCPESEWNKPSYPIADLFIAKVWPLTKEILNKFGTSLIVSERCMKLLKSAIRSCSLFLTPILPDMANLLHQGFQKSQFGCYLWVTGVLIREFGDEYNTNEEIKHSIYEFGIQQSVTVFEILFSKNTEEDFKRIPDVIEDFFRMVNDLLMFFPFKLIPNVEFLKNIFKSVNLTLSYVNEFEPIISCIHFMIDLVSWGLPNPPISLFEMGDTAPLRQTIQELLMVDNQGGELLKILINGLLFKFHADVKQDVNDLIIKILVVVPNFDVSLGWLNKIVRSLPHANEKEIDRLLGVIKVALPNKDNRRVRSALKDFISWYSRKNITPRSEF
ncbi:mRNA transport regulator MTR10 [Candida viswanathii]|uniref:mRNA transport regulator MTR10 n=1 Tax=Candida viswanathii TaxID=5486 RepID=A0A367YIT9_9ASCO|nr:mRNA transport regulator MTR10 [Candida viswanathii]